MAKTKKIIAEAENVQPEIANDDDVIMVEKKRGSAKAENAKPEDANDGEVIAVEKKKPGQAKKVIGFKKPAVVKKVPMKGSK